MQDLPALPLLFGDKRVKISAQILGTAIKSYGRCITEVKNRICQAKVENFRK